MSEKQKPRVARVGSLLALLAGIATIVGALLPWWSTPAEIPLDGVTVPSSIKGISSDLGTVALVAGFVTIVGALLSLLFRRRWPILFVLVGGGGAIVVSALVVADLNRWYMDAATSLAGIAGPENIELRAHLLGIVVGVHGYPTLEFGPVLVGAGGVLAVLTTVPMALRRRVTAERFPDGEVRDDGVAPEEGSRVTDSTSERSVPDPGTKKDASAGTSQTVQRSAGEPALPAPMPSDQREQLEPAAPGGEHEPEPVEEQSSVDEAPPEPAPAEESSPEAPPAEEHRNRDEWSF
jgi:hypothetical protein